MPATKAADLQVFKAAFFKALAHPVRIRILEVLVRGDRSVQELQQALGLEQPVVSQQLSVLRTSHIVIGRKKGNSVRYAVRDRLVADLLSVARRIFQQPVDRYAKSVAAASGRGRDSGALEDLNRLFSLAPYAFSRCCARRARVRCLAARHSHCRAARSRSVSL